jgi:guanylate kinase
MFKGFLVVISAPSGGGKTTLVRELSKKISDIYYSISLTTRLPRPGEKDGKDYHFVSLEKFQEHLKAKQLLEWAEVHGHWYGTPKEPINQHLKSGHPIILDIDVQGGKQIRTLMPEAILICIAPPSLGILESRLRARKQDTEETIQKRLKAAQKELLEAQKNYDYLIVNDTIPAAVDRLRSIIVAEQLKMKRSQAVIEKALK